MGPSEGNIANPDALRRFKADVFQVLSHPTRIHIIECLKTGEDWVHLRICRTCGHVGCCDSSKNKHATQHFQSTSHPIMESYDPPDPWGWCFVDKALFDLSDRMTPHNGPIPRYY